MQYKGVVEIVKKLDKICLFYLKNQDFIDLAKTKGYRWNEDDCCWYRRLNEETGKYPDRAAEIGHELLQVIMKKKEQDGLNMIPKIKFWHYTGVEETTKFTMHPEKL